MFEIEKSLFFKTANVPLKSKDNSLENKTSIYTRKIYFI